MNELRCIICKRQLPSEGVVEPVCGRFLCKERFDARKSLYKRIEDFTAFFAGKPITEEVYKEYFETIGIESEYRQFAGKGEIPKATRRLWFWANVISQHEDWPKENGSSRKAEN